VTARPDRTREQVIRFATVGLLNTLVDYVVFIALTVAFNISLSHVWLAKYPSSAVAMTISYVLNRRWVFRSRDANVGREFARFFMTTLIGVFVVQNLVTQLFASEFQFFGKATWRALDAAGSAPSETYTIATVAFAIGTLASLTWNFLVYKFWAFRPAATPDPDARGPAHR
jgi:putative flippase GtrA